MEKMKSYVVRRKPHDTSMNRFGYNPQPMGDSPVEQALKAGPRGDGSWAGFTVVYLRISRAADKMGRSSSRLSDVHVDTMADLGSGNEERMKARLDWLMSYGWLVNADLEETRLQAERLGS